MGYMKGTTRFQGHMNDHHVRFYSRKSCTHTETLIRVGVVRNIINAVVLRVSGLDEPVLKGRIQVAVDLQDQKALAFLTVSPVAITFASGSWMWMRRVISAGKYGMRCLTARCQSEADPDQGKVQKVTVA